MFYCCAAPHRGEDSLIVTKASVVELLVYITGGTIPNLQFITIEVFAIDHVEAFGTVVQCD